MQKITTNTLTLVGAGAVIAIGIATPIAVDIYAQKVYKNVDIIDAKILLYLSSSEGGILNFMRFICAVALYEMLDLIPYVLLVGYIIFGRKQVSNMYLEVWNSLILMLASLVPIFQVKRILISNSAVLPRLAYIVSIALSLVAIIHVNINFHYAVLSDIYRDGPSSSTAALVFAVTPFYGMAALFYVTIIVDIVALYYVSWVCRP